jgi:hypothetical protein
MSSTNVSVNIDRTHKLNLDEVRVYFFITLITVSYKINAITLLIPALIKLKGIIAGTSISITTSLGTFIKIGVKIKFHKHMETVIVKTPASRQLCFDRLCD